AVYGAARRLGFEPRAAACSSLLLATFSLVAFESTTSQNDLVAASFPIAAACLLLGNGRFEPALAGLAVGLGLGAKLTTALDLSVLSDHLIQVLWIAGTVAAALAAGYVLWRRRTVAAALVTAVVVALPFLSPLVVIHLGDLVASLARSGGFPVRGPLGNVGGLNRTVLGSAFGPLGAVVFLGVPLVTQIGRAS